MISVAIDGPAGAGKSSISKILSKNLGFLYFDTGALYRALSYYFIKNKLDYTNSDILHANLANVNIAFKFLEKEQRMFLCGDDITESLRIDKVSMAASKISAIPEAREFLLETQRKMARKNNIVMDGRDIGTVVLPNADVKIFLTADLEIRAMRRFKQLQQSDPHVMYPDVLEMIKKRDENDTEREISPLVPAKDAIVFDNTNFNLQKAVDELTKLVRKRINERKR